MNNMNLVIDNEPKDKRKNRTNGVKTKVLFGRSKQAFHNPGNAKFRSVITQYATDYLEAGNRRNRSKVVQAVFHHLWIDLGAEFYKPGTQGDWSLVPEREAKEKCSHALRDAARLEKKNAKSESFSTTQKKMKALSEVSPVLSKTVIGFQPVVDLQRGEMGLADDKGDQGFGAARATLALTSFRNKIRSDLKNMDSALSSRATSSSSLRAQTTIPSSSQSATSRSNLIPNTMSTPPLGSVNSTQASAQMDDSMLAVANLVEPIANPQQHTIEEWGRVTETAADLVASLEEDDWTGTKKREERRVRQTSKMSSLQQEDKPKPATVTPLFGKALAVMPPNNALLASTCDPSLGGRFRPEPALSARNSLSSRNTSTNSLANVFDY